MYKYPLQKDNFSFYDRLKACKFILNKNNRLTSGPKVAELEKKWEEIVGESKVKCVATSSGSTANHLLIETFLQTYNIEPREVVVFIPATTWASSVTPWIFRGCEIVFVDINLTDFSFDYEKLEEELKNKNAEHKVKVIWPTALIGFVPDIQKLKELKTKHNAFLFADLCETTLGFYETENILGCFDMATTSFFWAHEFTGIELGMLFIKNNLRYSTPLIENAQMIRSHGMTRVLPIKSETKSRAERLNPKVDPEFLFEKLGTNYRATDLNAFFCLLDTERYHDYIHFRTTLWDHLLENLPSRYLQLERNIIPFCLPFIKSPENLETIKDIKRRLNHNGWETRPIICSLPMNPAFKKYAKGQIFPNSRFLNDNGFYVGLNKDLKIVDIEKLLHLI